jgi:hypothetical protein
LCLFFFFCIWYIILKGKKEGSDANILPSEGEDSRRLGLIARMLSFINLTPRQILTELSNQERQI